MASTAAINSLPMAVLCPKGVTHQQCTQKAAGRSAFAPGTRLTAGLRAALRPCTDGMSCEEAVLQWLVRAVASPTHGWQILEATMCASMI